MSIDYTSVARARRLDALASLQARQAGGFDGTGTAGQQRISSRNMQTVFQWRSVRSGAARA